MRQVVRAEPALEHALEEVPAASDLGATVRALLSSACDAVALVTLELEVVDCPELTCTVRRDAAPLGELSVWLTRHPPTRWHGGLTLVASAADAAADRRAVVGHTATLIGELLGADARATRAETLARRALELAGVDALTQVGNRRTWQRSLEDESRRAARYRTATTVVVVDLDGLKRINDEHGHAAGDAFLQRAAQAVHAAARSVDVVCRLGGDEFALLAPQTDPDGGSRLVARLRSALAAAEVEASVGVATTLDGQLQQAWQSADEDMYQDKRARVLS